jgi:hypothetical protein
MAGCLREQGGFGRRSNAGLLVFRRAPLAAGGAGAAARAGPPQCRGPGRARAGSAPQHPTGGHLSEPARPAAAVGGARSLPLAAPPLKEASEPRGARAPRRRRAVARGTDLRAGPGQQRSCGGWCALCVACSRGCAGGQRGRGAPRCGNGQLRAEAARRGACQGGGAAAPSGGRRTRERGGQVHHSSRAYGVLGGRRGRRPGPPPVQRRSGAVQKKRGTKIRPAGKVRARFAPGAPRLCLLSLSSRGGVPSQNGAEGAAGAVPNPIQTNTAGPQCRRLNRGCRETAKGVAEAGKRGFFGPSSPNKPDRRSGGGFETQAMRKLFWAPVTRWGARRVCVQGPRGRRGCAAGTPRRRAPAAPEAAVCARPTHAADGPKQKR